MSTSLAQLRFSLRPMMVATLAASAVSVGCTQEVDRHHEVGAMAIALTEEGNSIQVESARYTTVGLWMYEAYGSANGATYFHHLEVADYRDGPGAPQLEAGRHYIDGPTVNNRGYVEDHLGADGRFHGDLPMPWIDLRTCNGNYVDFMTHPDCRVVGATELWLENTETEAFRVHYRGSLAGEEPGSVAGSYLALPNVERGGDTWNYVPQGSSPPPPSP